MVCQVGRIRYKPYWVWNLGLIIDFSRLLSWAPLHDLTTSRFPRFLFFFFFFVTLFRNLEFCLLCCSVTLSWLRLHSDPCAEVDRGKQQQGYTLPFWNHNSYQTKILLSVLVLEDFLSWWPPLPGFLCKPMGSLCSDLTTNVVTLSCFEVLRKSIWTVYKLLLKGK